MSISSEIHVGRYRLRCCTSLRLLYNCYTQCALNIVLQERHPYSFSTQISAFYVSFSAKAWGGVVGV